MSSNQRENWFDKEERQTGVCCGGLNSPSNDEAAEQSDVSPVIPTIKQNIALGVIFCLLCFLQKIPSLFGG